MSINCTDPKTIDDLYRKTGPYIFEKCRKMVASRPVAEEILQDVYMSLLSSKLTFEMEKQAFKWLYKAAHNKCIDHLRKSQTRLEVQSDTYVDHQVSDSDLGQLVQSAANARKLLAGLPKRTAQIFWYVSVDELTQEETAALLNISRPTVAREIKSGKQMLKKMMERQDG